MSSRSLVLLAALAGLVPGARAAAPHPVVVLLSEEDDNLNNETAPIWTRSHEAALDEIAASTQARSPGAQEALRAEFAMGRLLAGGVLWKLTGDAAIVDRILDVMANQSPRSPGGVSEHAFLLGYIGDRRAIAGLWAAAERFRHDPFEEIFCARAIYRIETDPKALAIIRRRSRNKYPRWENADVPLSLVAKRVADELEKTSGGKP